MHFAKFPIREIKVVGQYQHLDEDQVSMISDRFVKGNFFSLDLFSTKEAFTKLPWVRNVSLRRVWPDHLEVLVEEHQAIGRWGAQLPSKAWRCAKASHARLRCGTNPTGINVVRCRACLAYHR